MVDPLRYELTQVARRCPKISLKQPDLNKILNGKYKEVIDNYLDADRYAPSKSKKSTKKKD